MICFLKYETDRNFVEIGGRTIYARLVYLIGMVFIIYQILLLMNLLDVSVVARMRH